MKNKQGIKIFIVLFLSTFFIFAFSHYGASAFNSIINNADNFDENTVVGNVNISGKNESEAMKAVDEQLTLWLNEMVINIHFKENQIQLDNALFRFNITESVKTAQNGQQNTVIVQFEENTLEDSILNSYPLIDSRSIDFEKLQTDLLKSATRLQSEQLELKLEDYITSSSINEDVVIHEVQVKTDVVYFSSILEKPIEIPANNRFSLLKLIEEKGFNNMSADALNAIASGIYQLILPTNFAIIERNIGNEKPEYIPLGFEAKVDSQKNIDLIFVNPNEIPYEINMQFFDSVLILSLKGKSFLNKYEVISNDEQSFKPKIIKQYNSLLKPSEKVVERQGKEGLFIKVFREIYDEKGALLRSEAISEDFYPPIHQIEVYGLINKADVEASRQAETRSENTESLDDNQQSNNSNHMDEEAIGEVIKSNSDLWGKPFEKMK
ncbi:hypothetical protein V7122_07300 [Bacillus sp. JJ1532]|uniref:hypothetical protein n=1 Tax=unclassified Bacillus (in: firmicutes) TaxID=185979 RepID=UPI002FFD97EA